MQEKKNEIKYWHNKILWCGLFNSISTPCLMPKFDTDNMHSIHSNTNNFQIFNGTVTCITTTGHSGPRSICNELQNWSLTTGWNPSARDSVGVFWADMKIDFYYSCYNIPITLVKK